MCTRSGRPLLEHDDRSLWERPRGLGSPGSPRTAGGGAGASDLRAPAASGPAGSPGSSEGRRPASAIGSRRLPARSAGWGRRRGLRGRARGDPQAARRAGRLDAGRREAGRGGGGGRRKRTEKFAQEGAAYRRLVLPGESRRAQSWAAPGARGPARLLLPQTPGTALYGVAAGGLLWLSAGHPTSGSLMSGLGFSSGDARSALTISLPFPFRGGNSMPCKRT